MNQEIKTLWTQALRSGEYEQGTRALRTRSQGIEKHCCLGVLCDLAVEADVLPAPKLNSDGGEYEYQNGSDPAYTWPEKGVLPTSVVTWAGLQVSNPPVTCNGELESLATVNDNGYTFDEIADMIDADL